MPGKNRREAYEVYTEPLKAVLRCVADAHIVDRLPHGDEPGTFAFTQNPAPLGNSGLAFFFLQRFTIVRIEEEFWKVRTESYTYAIERLNPKQEIFVFHWEGHGRGKVPYPHMHVGFGLKCADPPVDPRIHVPSGRVAVEDVVHFLITELGVKPAPSRADDWAEVIARAREAFMTHKSW